MIGLDHRDKTPAHNSLLFLFLLTGANVILGASLWWGNLFTGWILVHHEWAFKIPSRPFNAAAFPIIFIIIFLVSAYPIVRLKKWGLIVLTAANAVSALYFYRFVVSVKLLSAALFFSPAFFILGATWVFSPPVKKLFRNIQEARRIIKASERLDPRWNLRKLGALVGIVFPLLFGTYYLAVALFFYLIRK